MESKCFLKKRNQLNIFGHILDHPKQMGMLRDLIRQYKMNLLIIKIDTATYNIKQFDQKLDEWLTYYNTIRPHQSLNYMTPNNYLVQLQKGSSQSLKCVWLGHPVVDARTFGIMI